MKPYKLCSLALLCAWSVTAMAQQWQWIDKDGRKVFSDRPPALDIPDKNILRRPHQPTHAPAATAAASAPDAAASNAAPNAGGKGDAGKGTDKVLEERKAKAEADAEAAKAAKDKADEQKRSAARAENCARAKAAKASLESGQLVRHTNAKGEQVFMDDATRAAERKRAQAVIDSSCKP